MPHRSRLAVLLAAGLVVRVIIALTTRGLTFDLQSYALVDHALHTAPLHVYALVNSPSLYRWPYPPGFFPFALLSGSVAHLTGLAYTEVVRLPSVLADLLLAWVIEAHLRRRGVPEARRLLAAGMVLLGPLFVSVSAYNGQIDALAILPALFAVGAWESIGSPRRALVCGLAIGVGCALKSFPLLALLALLPTCRSRREATVLCGCAVAVPVVALAPWVLADGHAVLRALSYHSLAGTGGISLLAQPDLARIWLGGPVPRLTSFSHTLQGSLSLVLEAIGVAVGVLLGWRARARGPIAASLLWVSLFVFSVNFGPRYAIWGLPFLLLAGRLAWAAALQALFSVPELLLLLGSHRGGLAVTIYVVLMIAGWVACLLCLVQLRAGADRRRRAEVRSA